MGNTLLAEPVDTGVKSACAACKGVTRGRGDILCGACWTKAPTLLVSAYRVAWNGVQFEGQPEGRLEAALANLVAGVRGEPPPYAEPPPLEAIASPRAPASPARSILPPLDDVSMPTTRTVSSTCVECASDFEYETSAPGGRRRTRCPRHDGSSPEPEKRNGAKKHVVARAKPAVVPLTGESLDIGGVREQLQAELESIDQRRERVVRLLEAFDAYEGSAE